MAEWTYSQLIFMEKNHVYLQCRRYAFAAKDSDINPFSGNVET